MIIDSHHHLWDLSKGYTWLEDPALAPIHRTFTVEDLRVELRANGVSQTILVEAGRGQTAEVNEFLELAAGTSEIAGIVGWCDITAPSLPESPWLLGARDQVQGQADPDFLTRQDVLCGLHQLEDQGLVFDLVIRMDQINAAATAAAAVPGLTFVLDHLGKPSIRDGQAGLLAWLAPIKRLAAQENVYAKLSGLITEAGPHWTPDDLEPFISTALELFGPERLMFGSDWPVCNLAGTYGEVIAALDQNLSQLSDSERDCIYSGTAINAYRLFGLTSPDS